MNRCRFTPRTSSSASSERRSLILMLSLLALVAATLVSCGSDAAPVENLESIDVRPVVSPDPLEGLQPSDFSTPEESQVLQVWCVYEFDTDACVELDEKFGFNQDNNFGLPADLKTRSVEVLEAECARGTQDRVSCAELASR